MGLSAYSDSTVTDLKRDSDKRSTETSRKIPNMTLAVVSCMAWKSSGLSSNIPNVMWKLTRC